MNISECRIGDVVHVCDRAGRRRHDGVVIGLGEDKRYGPFATVMSFHDQPFDVAPYSWPLAELRTIDPARTITQAELARLTTAAGDDPLLCRHLATLIAALGESRAA
jgi:hypothetical protein